VADLLWLLHSDHKPKITDMSLSPANNLICKGPRPAFHWSICYTCIYLSFSLVQ